MGKMNQEEMDEIRNLIAEALNKHSKFTLVGILYGEDEGDLLFVEVDNGSMITLQVSPS